MYNQLLYFTIVPLSIIVSVGLVALVDVVARYVMPRRHHPSGSDFRTPREQFDSWPGGRTKIELSGEKIVRTRAKTDPQSGISFYVREEA